MNLIGELIRFGDSHWSLMMVDSVVDEAHGTRVYGEHLMGGRIGADIEYVYPETEEDWDRWDSCEKFRIMRRRVRLPNDK